MARVPENINFCIFGECHYLSNDECTVESCIFSGKWFKWWEKETMKGWGVISRPPDGKYKVMNLYVDPDTGRLTIEYDTGGV